MLGHTVSEKYFTSCIKTLMELMRPICEKNLQCVSAKVLSFDETFKWILRVRGQPIYSLLVARNELGEVFIVTIYSIIIIYVGL